MYLVMYRKCSCPRGDRFHRLFPIFFASECDQRSYQYFLTNRGLYFLRQFIDQGNKSDQYAIESDLTWRAKRERERDRSRAVVFFAQHALRSPRSKSKHFITCLSLYIYIYIHVQHLIAFFLCVSFMCTKMFLHQYFSLPLNTPNSIPINVIVLLI